MGAEELGGCVIAMEGGEKDSGRLWTGKAETCD